MAGFWKNSHMRPRRPLSDADADRYYWEAATRQREAREARDAKAKWGGGKVKPSEVKKDITLPYRGPGRGSKKGA